MATEDIRSTWAGLKLHISPKERLSRLLSTSAEVPGRQNLNVKVYSLNVEPMAKVARTGLGCARIMAFPRNSCPCIWLVSSSFIIGDDEARRF